MDELMFEVTDDNLSVNRSRTFSDASKFSEHQNKLHCKLLLIQQREKLHAFGAKVVGVALTSDIPEEDDTLRQQMDNVATIPSFSLSLDGGIYILHSHLIFEHFFSTVTLSSFLSVECYSRR